MCACGYQRSSCQGWSCRCALFFFLHQRYACILLLVWSVIAWLRSSFRRAALCDTLLLCRLRSVKALGTSHRSLRWRVAAVRRHNRPPHRRLPREAPMEAT